MKLCVCFEDERRRTKAMELKCVFLLLYILDYLSSCSTFENNIIISNSTGNDNPDCLVNQTQACATLQYVLETVTNDSVVGRKLRTSTKIQINDDHANLTRNYHLRALKHFAVIGESKGTRIGCMPEVGLIFSSSVDIILTNITFLNCGSKQAAQTSKEIFFYAGLYFSDVTNLTITYCNVTNSKGIGLAMVDVGGVVVLSHTNFIGNINRSINGSKVEHGLAHVGGGLTIEFTYNHTSNVTAKYNNYKFFNCIFKNNGCAWKKESDRNPDEANNNNVIFGCGGGMAVTFKNTSQGNIVELEHCIFKNNLADWGGGYYFLFEGEAIDNFVYLRNVAVESNHANLAGGGGRFSFIPSPCHKKTSVSLPKPNHFKQEFCNYTDNVADWGGGVSVFGSQSSNLSQGEGKTLTFNCTHWKNNKAFVGSALGIVTNNMNFPSRVETNYCYGLPYVIDLQNSTFMENSIRSSNNGSGKSIVGTGIVYIDGAPIKMSNVNFTSNSGTSLVLDLSYAYINDNVSFHKNNGSQGGAMALFGRSKIILGENSFLIFDSNRASLRGGAIYAYSQGPNLKAFPVNLLERSTCFFGYITDEHPDNWTAKVIFENNNAPKRSGKSVYCDTLQFCRNYGDLKTALQWKPFDYHDNMTDEPEVFTDPVEMKTSAEDWSGFAGKTLFPKIRLLDEKGDETNGLLKMSVSSSTVRVDKGEHISDYIYVAGGNSSAPVSFLGNDSGHFQVTLSAVYTQMMTTVVENVSIKNTCYGGYKFDSGKRQCVCLSRGEMPLGYRRCGGDGVRIYLKEEYWATVGNGSHLIVLPCPLDYCKCPEGQKPIDLNYGNNVCEIKRLTRLKAGTNQSQCMKNRMGRLCGSCEPGYSVVVGTNECHRCESNIGALYLLPILVVLTLAVWAILYFELDFFSGPLNSWLYIYHIVHLLPYKRYFIDPFINGVISLTNGEFDVSIGTCFWKGMDKLQKLVLQYLVPFYSLLLLYFLHKLLRNFPNLRNRLLANRSFHRAFVTIAIISYSALTETTFSILYPIHVDGKWYVYYQADVTWFGDQHLPYAIPALLIFLFIVLPFPIVIAFNSYFTARVQRLRNFIPLFEAIQSPYRTNRSWFASYYIFCRLLLILTLMFRNYFEHTIFPFLEAICVIILLVFVLLRPYTDENYIYFHVDTCFLSLLCVIICGVNAMEVNEDKVSVRFFQTMVHVLIYIPFVYSLVLFLCYLHRNLKACRSTAPSHYEPLS